MFSGERETVQWEAVGTTATTKRMLMVKRMILHYKRFQGGAFWTFCVLWEAIGNSA